jgi:tRNA wybutosine-synthesizing protein 1
MNMSYEPFKKQGYHIIGTHGAVKPCLWTGRSIKKQGTCYKSKFYAIQSHRCIQMTPYLGCNQKCLHCWRPIEHTVAVPEQWDAPVELVEGCIEAQRKLLSGYGGLKSVERSRWIESNEPQHAAISLAGEPALYPYLDELIDEFHQRGLTTFVVTNGTKPDIIRNIKPTQLYLSLNAPDKQTYITSCNPHHIDQWDQIIHSLEVMQDHVSRKVIRLTLVKGHNFKDTAGYARLIAIAEPDFIEVKAYMHLGYSRKRLEKSAMPEHSEIAAFASMLADETGYDLIDQVEISRVVLLSNKKITPLLL